MELDRAQKELLTIRDFIRWASSRFNENRLCFGHGTDNARDEAERLILNALHLQSECCDDLLDSRLTADERKLLSVVIATRVHDRIPAAYINGKTWFAGLEFKVDERALIPRSPLAEVVEQGFQPWIDPNNVKRVLDLCTGGGCIGIASAVYLPDSEVHLSDISEDALQLARINVDAHQLADRVSLFQSDLYAALNVDVKYDVIVSNPPYVDQDDFDSMPPEYRHEPELGLRAGRDGLDIVKRILVEAADFLTPDGILLAEVGNSAAALEKLYPAVPFTWLELARGGHGVFVFSKRELEQYF